MSNQDAMPTAVQNLRRIWESKKIEMHFNQTEAAEELGWTQGAISHYLNAITEMNAPAVIKLANFLNVDPLEIDPDIVHNLPHIKKVLVTMGSDDVTKKQTKSMYIRDDIESFYVEVVGNRHLENHPEFILINSFDKSITGYAVCCLPEKYAGNTLIAVRLKKEKLLRFYLKTEMPPANTIHTLWAVISMNYQ